MNMEIQKAKAMTATLLAEKEELQRYLNTQLPQLQRELAERT
jgi:hypothetical protein